MRKKAWFFKNKALWGILGVMLVFGIVLVSCGGDKNSTTSNVFIFSGQWGIIGRPFLKIGVIANDKIKFYDPLSMMKEVQFSQFNLPSGYKGAFVGVNNDLCVIVDGKVKSYQNWEGTWEESKSDFTLPSGYKGAVSGWDWHLGIIIGNKVTFYGYNSDSDTWKEDVNIEKFTLPSGYKGVYASMVNDTNYLCVTAGGKIKLYTYNNGWEELAEVSLPSGFKGDVIGLFDDNGLAIVTDGKVKIYNADNGGEIQDTGEEFTIPK